MHRFGVTRPAEAHPSVSQNAPRVDPNDVPPNAGSMTLVSVVDRHIGDAPLGGHRAHGASRPPADRGGQASAVVAPIPVDSEQGMGAVGG